MNTTATPSRVLVVEDDHDALSMMCLLLEGWGYTVDTACSGRDALTRIQENCPAVVISDLLMPGMSGIELLKAIKTHRQDCVIFFILTTGYGTVHNGIDAIVAGADEVLLKPIESDTLHYLLKRHGFYGSADVQPKGATT